MLRKILFVLFVLVALVAAPVAMADTPTNGGGSDPGPNCDGSASCGIRCCIPPPAVNNGC